MSPESRFDDRRADPPGKRKKAYEPPQLVIYGDIAALTRVVGYSGKPDGGPQAKGTRL